MARLIMTLHYHQGELDVRKLAITSNQIIYNALLWIKGQTNCISFRHVINKWVYIYIYITRVYQISYIIKSCLVYINAVLS